MLVETRREDFAPVPPEGEQGGAVLRDLLAAALVSHEAIGDPDRIAGGEPAALRALCRCVAGPIYRVAPFHYAFAAGAETAASLAARLAAEIGPEALWIAALDHLAAPAAAAPEGPPATALLLLEARETATREGLAIAGPELLAVIDARYAVDCARLIAEAAGPVRAADAAAEDGAIAARLDAIEARLETGLAALSEEAARSHAAALARATAAEDALGARIAALAAFEERVALALAEFLARLEQREAARRPADGAESVPDVPGVVAQVAAEAVR